MIKAIRRKIPLSDIAKKGIYGAGWLTIEKIISMIISLLVSVFIARNLGPSVYGELSYLLAIIAMVSPIAALGLNGIVVSELINYPEKESKIIATVFLLRFIGAVIELIICFMFLYFGDISFVAVQKQYAILALLCSGALFCSLFDLSFQARMRVNKTAKMRVILLSIFSVVKIINLVFDGSVNALILVFALEYLTLGCF